MLKKIILLTLLLAGSIAFADCTAFSGELKLDGKLDEAAWKNAKKHTNFSKFARIKKNRKVAAQTEFSVIHDGEAVYFGILCKEPDMQKALNVPQGGRWNNESIEIFLCPSGNPMEYYQFLVTLNNNKFARFYDEFGVTQPDPYFEPVWQSAVYTGKDFWSIEVRIPLTAFYMTRHSLWASNWKVNVARSHRFRREHTTWSPLSGIKGFGDSRAFRGMKGFPMRKANDDFHIKSAEVKVNSRENGKLKAEMEVIVFSPVDGKFRMQYEGRNIRNIILKKGDNTIKFPCLFDDQGRFTVKLGVAHYSGKAYERYYPVRVKFDPLSVKLTLPGYRNNFYPGQDSSKIKGFIEVQNKGDVELTLIGPGLAPRTIVLKQSGEFSFDTSKLEFGTAVLSVKQGDESRTVKIRRLPPSKRMMTWVENGNVILNGKPILRRQMYGPYYMGGVAFNKRYVTDSIHDSPEFRLSGAIGRIEPARMVRGIEGKEATRDVKPCQAIFDAIDKCMEKWKNIDFPYYYISDEPECRGISPIYLKHIYDYVTEKDPYHVVLTCSRSAANYLDCADWFETHPYINPRIDASGKRVYGRPINSVGSYVDQISKLNRPDKVIGFCPTSFYSQAVVTFAEYVCHTYAGMIHGGKSLFPYAYHDLGDRPVFYEGNRYIFSSFERLQDFFLFGKRTVLKRTEEYEAVLFENKNDKMFVIVNFTQEPQKVEIPGLSGDFFEFRGSRKFTSNRFTLKKHETIVGTSRKMDEGLPTYAAVDALINKQEYARTHRGNLLHDIQDELVITSSVAVKSFRKMFDGTTDVIAWYQNHRDKWYEISFPKTIPTFKKIRIYGHNINDFKVSIRKRGEWLDLKPAKIEKGEYMECHELAVPTRTVKMRISFPCKKRVELYEIELLK